MSERSCNHDPEPDFAESGQPWLRLKNHSLDTHGGVIAHNCHMQASARRTGLVSNA